jgi:hypothetical protein
MSNALLYVPALCQLMLVAMGIGVTVHERLSKKHKLLVWGLFVAVAAVGLWATVKEARLSSAEIAIANAKLSSSLNSLQESLAAQARLSSLNGDLQAKLLRQSDTITALARQNIGETTGGDSFCYLAFTPMGGSRFLLVAIPKGRFPLRNVTASINDVEKFKKATTGKPITFDTILNPSVRYTRNLTIGDLPRESQHAGKVGFPEYDADDSSNYQALNIFFLALNGAWTEMVRMKRVDGKWVQATRVITSTGPDVNKEKILFEQVNPQYPEKAGKINWDH